MPRLILLAVLTGLMHAARSFDPASGLGASAGGTVMGAGYLLLGAYLAGQIFRGIGLPTLTGYLMMGILAGPSIANLVDERMLADLSIFNGVATALIALNAGSELDFRAIRPLLKGIRWIAGTSLLITFALLSASLILLRGFLPFASQMDTVTLIAFGAPLAVTLCAQSPAVVVALRKELNASGPVTDTVLGLVVVAEIVVVLAFAATSTIAKVILGGAGNWLETLAHITWEIPGSMLIGAALGAIIAAFMRSVKNDGALFVVLTGFLVAEVGRRIGLDILLVALVAGIVVRNYTRYGKELHAAIDGGSLPVYVTFFAVAGASLHVDALLKMFLPVVAFCVIRGAGYLGGAQIGARIAASDVNVRRNAGFGMLPQAGLALSLAALFVNQFPTHGAGASALIFGVVAVNELVAPVLYRMAIVRSGEAKPSAPAEGSYEDPVLSGSAPAQ